MKKIYLAFLLFQCLCLCVQAQTISLNYANEACLRSVQILSVSINGEFKADNQFTVQVRQSDNSRILSETPAVLKNGQIEVTHTDTLLRSYTNLQLRILTSSPKTETNWAGFRINGKGLVHLESAASDTVNIGDDLSARFISYNSNTSNSIRVTLNDSSRYSFYSYSDGYVNNQTLVVKSAAPFFIAHAENFCGAMSVSGQIKTVINATALRSVSVSPAAVCEDGEIKVSFSTQGPAFSAQTKYRLRFIEANPYDQKVRKAEVVAVLKDNVLIAKIPNNFSLKQATQFRIQILTENPSIAGASDGGLVNIFPKAKVEFASSSTTINIGQSASMNFNFSGLPPFSAELQDGTFITSSYSGNNYSNSVKPDKTTSYTIKSFTSGCGQVSDPSPQTLVITVNQGIYVENDGDRQPLCAGSVGRISFLSNSNINANTSYVVRAKYNDSNQTEASFPAKKVGNFLEFTIPATPENNRGLSYDQLYGFYVVTANPTATSNVSYKYFIQSTPDIASTSSALAYAVPGRVYLNFQLKGRGPITIEDMDGKKYQGSDQYWSNEFYLKETTDFKLKSISNSCFKNSNVQPVRITLNSANAPTGVYLDPIKSPVCFSDSIEITFRTTGSFNQGNVFNIQACASCSTLPTVATVQAPGKYKIKVPATSSNSSNGYFRIASTNPVFFSEQLYVEFNRLPSNFSISPQGTERNPTVYLKGEEVYLSIGNSGGSVTSFTYSDGGPYNVTQFDNINYYRQKVSPPVGATTLYTVKHVANSCGPVEVNLTTYIKVIPYRIVLSDYYNSSICIGQPLTVPFNVTQGNPGNATFSLQIARTNSSDFVTLVKDETSRSFSTIIPSSLTEGSYQFRIVSSDGSVSELRDIRVGAAPTVSMTTDQPQPIFILPGNSLVTKLNFTGLSPWTVLYNDNTKQVHSYTPETRYFYPNVGQEYSIKTIYNSCGYGTATGTIAVKVKPQLYVSSDSYNVCQGGTFNVTYELRGDADLTNDYIRFELVDNNTQKVTVLDSTKTLSGKRLLSIPATLSGSSYQIRCTVKSYSLSYAIGVGITTKTNFTLSGNTVINPGESARLILKNNKTGISNYETVTYKLSDGTVGYTSSGSQQETYVIVKPAQTTTYTLSSASNNCGEGTVRGSALVEVNAPSERTVTVTSLVPITGSGSCLGDTVMLYFDTKGTFSGSNKMTVQISDTTGKNFRSTTTIGNNSPLKAVIPTDLFSGKNYRIKIIATDANTGSGAYQNPVVFSQKPKARFASESVLYDGVTNPKIVVLLEGGNYWSYRYGTDLSVQNRSTSNSSDTITLFQASPNQYYKLFQVQNNCGLGTIGTPGTVRVEVITGEPAPLTSQITVGPNPTQDFLLIKFENASPRTITLFDKRGIPAQTRISRRQEENIDIRNVSPGIYILQIENKGKKESFKVIKQ